MTDYFQMHGFTGGGMIPPRFGRAGLGADLFGVRVETSPGVDRGDAFALAAGAAVKMRFLLPSTAVTDAVRAAPGITWPQLLRRAELDEDLADGAVRELIADGTLVLVKRGRRTCFFYAADHPQLASLAGAGNR